MYKSQIAQLKCKEELNSGWNQLRESVEVALGKNERVFSCVRSLPTAQRICPPILYSVYDASNHSLSCSLKLRCERSKSRSIEGEV
jgi:hypothetical protein